MTNNKEPNLSRPLNNKEERELAKRIEKGDEEAKRELIEANLRLVVSIAEKYTGQSPDFTLSDLIREGNLGLLKAAETFNWRKEYTFSSYATYWIRDSIYKALGLQPITIKSGSCRKPKSHH